MDSSINVKEKSSNRLVIAKGALTNLAGIFVKSLNVVFFIFLGRFYGPEITGMYLLSLSAIDIISKISILGLDRTLMSEGARNIASEDENGFYRTLSNAVIIGFTASLAVFLLTELSAGTIASVILKKDELELPIRIMGISLFFWTFSAIFIAASRSALIMKYEIMVKSVSEPLVMLVSALILYRYDLGITALCIAFVISSATGTCAAVYLFSRKFSLKKLSKSIQYGNTGLKEIFRLSFPTGVYDMLNLLLQRVDFFVLTRLTSVATAGVYGIAVEIAFVVKKVRQSFDPVFIPVVSGLFEKKDFGEIKTHLKNVTRWILTIDLYILLVLMTGGKYITSVFGSEFSYGFYAMLIMAFATLINGSFGVSELFLLIEKPWINLANTAVVIIFSIFLNILLVPYYGMTGAAVSMLISYILMNCARITEVFIIYKLSPFSADLHKVIFAGTVSAALIPAVKSALQGFQYSDILLVTTVPVFFTGLLLYIKALPELKSLLIKIKRRFHYENGIS